MMGRSFTVSEIAVVWRSSKTTGSRSASITARRSRRSCVNSFWACAKMRRMIFLLVLGADLAALAGLLDHADEDVFERETPFARPQHSHSRGFEPFGILANAGIDTAVRNDVQAFAEQRNAPMLRFRFQEIGRALRLVHAKFQQMTFL